MTERAGRFVPSPAALGFWLAVPLVVAKATHWGWPDRTWGDVLAWLRDVGVSSWADVAFAAAFGLLAAALLAAARRLAPGPLKSRVGEALVAAGTLFVLYGVASAWVFVFLRSPLTYPLLYLAGDLKAMRSSISSFVGPAQLALLVLVPAAYVVAVGWTSRPGPVPARRGLRAVPVVLAGLAALWTAWGYRVADGKWSDRPDALIAQGPHWTILKSLALDGYGWGTPRIAEEFPPEFLSDFRPGAVAATRLKGPRPRNVILVVLETTGTRYLSLHGSRYPTTPNLEAEAAHAMVFDNFYAHVGMTANSLAALSLSIHPYMTWREYTQEYPDFPGDTVAEVLGPMGYRTAFLTSSYLDYVGIDEFLRHRGFGEVRDWQSLKGGDEISSWGGSEAVLVDRTFEWIDRDRGKPFYAVLWTEQSHHPYEPAPGQPIVDFFAGGPVPEDDWDLGRHLNTLAEVDRQMARLFAGLRRRGLDRDTLVVVTGDHGECFGSPHETWGHGFKLYDEGVKVPLILWSPALFEGSGRSATIGGHVDVNPTILDILGLRAPGSWEGRSLLAAGRPPRVYFYAANDDYLLGVREGDFKYIYNATRGREELYDLPRDQDEQVNVAERHPDRCRVLRQRLAAWKHHAAGQLARGREKLARGQV